MRKLLFILFLFVLLLTGCGPAEAVRTVPAAGLAETEVLDEAVPTESMSDQEGVDMYLGLRGLAFTTQADDYEWEVPVAPGDPYGIVMDIGFEGDLYATITAYASGETSFYTSRGGGVLGASFENEGLYHAALNFVVVSKEHLGAMLLVEDGLYPLPGPDEISFYVLTSGGVYSVSVLANDMLDEGHVLYALFSAANDLLTEYRLMDESGK